MARKSTRKASASTPATPMRRPLGRPRKDLSSVAPDVSTVNTSPPKRRGRPPKHAVVAKAPRTDKSATTSTATSITKRRGRPPKDAASTAVVAKRVTPRIDPRVRSKLRTRVAKAEKPVPVKEVSVPARRRGRPPKASVSGSQVTKGTKAKATKKKGTKAYVTKKKAPTARVTKPAPRKRRGYVSLDVPDKFAAQVQQYLLDLQATEEAGKDQNGEVVEEEEAPISTDAIEEPNGAIGEEEHVDSNDAHLEGDLSEIQEEDQQPIEVLFEQEIIEQIQS